MPADTQSKIAQEACRKQENRSVKEAVVQMADELQTCIRSERERLLTAAGLPPGEIEPGAGLAMKAELGIPWHKLQHLIRYIP